jgi:hypothetical protein
MKHPISVSTKPAAGHLFSFMNELINDIEVRRNIRFELMGRGTTDE